MSKENRKRMAIICRGIGVILMIAAVTWIIGISLLVLVERRIFNKGCFANAISVCILQYNI